MEYIVELFGIKNCGDEKVYRNLIKRIIDLIISIIAIILLIPLWIIIPILIKHDDGGPVFYMAPRIGKDSKRILMYKFRSMKVDNDDIRNADGSTYNSEDDPRVTNIGKKLRSTSIDELPQLFNVLKGEMSLIGPRASTWDALTTYKDDEIDKMRVRPGITGYCQAYFRNGISAREKRVKDAWYANNVSFILDVKIFFKTIYTVLLRKNIYTNR